MIMSETEENDWCAFCLTATDNNRKKIGMAKMFLFFLQTRHTKNINVTVKFRTCVKRKTWNAVPCSVQGNELSKTETKLNCNR